jgi:hypothetical protein
MTAMMLSNSKPYSCKTELIRYTSLTQPNRWLSRSGYSLIPTSNARRRSGRRFKKSSPEADLCTLLFRGAVTKRQKSCLVRTLFKYSSTASESADRLGKEISNSVNFSSERCCLIRNGVAKGASTGLKKFSQSNARTELYFSTSL